MVGKVCCLRSKPCKNESIGGGGGLLGVLKASERVWRGYEKVLLDLIGDRGVKMGITAAFSVI